MDRFKQYKGEVQEALVRFKDIDYAFIFGSSTKTLLPESDIDILIGGRLDFLKRVDLALELESILGRKVDIVLAKEASPELVIEAFSSGFSLVINNKESLKRDYFRNLYLYEDSKNLRNLRISRIKRRHGYG